MNSLTRMLPALLRQAEDSPEAREYAVFAAWGAALLFGFAEYHFERRMKSLPILARTLTP